MPGNVDGSSPQARGTLLMILLIVLMVRFIPAGTGNTSVGASSDIRRAVHPRRHGEHLRTRRAKRLNTGSSPQARGTRAIIALIPTIIRFIPAGTGNTDGSDLTNEYPAVHPRRHGEHCYSLPCCRYDVGSSPQARGTHLGAFLTSLNRRFIPAGTGNTRSRGFKRLTTAVHPRRHGEHRWSHQSLAKWNGSSPQARGTLNN